MKFATFLSTLKEAKPHLESVGLELEFLADDFILDPELLPLVGPELYEFWSGGGAGDLWLHPAGVSHRTSSVPLRFYTPSELRSSFTNVFAYVDKSSSPALFAFADYGGMGDLLLLDRRFLTNGNPAVTDGPHDYLSSLFGAVPFAASFNHFIDALLTHLSVGAASGSLVFWDLNAHIDFDIDQRSSGIILRSSYGADGDQC